MTAGSRSAFAWTARRASLVALCGLALVGTACSAEADDDVFTEQDLALLTSMVLDPVKFPPIDPGNDLFINAPSRRNAMVVLGQRLFFDKGLCPPRFEADGGLFLPGVTPDAGVILTSDVSCATCHAPSEWFSDARGTNHLSQGRGWTGRNSPSLVNVGYYLSFGWDGRADSLWAQGKHAYESPRTMHGDKLYLLQQVARRYGQEFNAAFGVGLPTALLVDGPTEFTPPRPPSAETQLDELYRGILKAWSAYLLQLSSGNAPFDRFAKGDHTALAPDQRRGLRLFLGKAGCISCHNGPLFTDNQFHSIGVRQKGINVPTVDQGRFAGLLELASLPPSFRLTTPPPPTEADKGRFRTKSLRHVARTGPWFHAGQAATLTDVVWFYAQGGDRVGNPSPMMVPLDLSEAEQADLVAFLGALTGDPVPPRFQCGSGQCP